MSATVRQVLERKPSGVISTETTSTAFDAMALMAEKGVGSLIVRTKTGKLSGIVSERDFFRKVMLKELDPNATAVRQIMTPQRKLITVKPQTTLTDCMVRMTEHRIRHLPVVNRTGEAVGMLSIGDVVKCLSSEKDLMIEQLEHYIGSSL
jgi:CBS domain-containing protein